MWYEEVLQEGVFRKRLNAWDKPGRQQAFVVVEKIYLITYAHSHIPEMGSQLVHCLRHALESVDLVLDDVRLVEVPASERLALARADGRGTRR